MSSIKVKELIGKEWNHVMWHEGVWKDRDEARGIEPLSSDEFLLPV